MNRILLCAALALGLAGCGGETQAPAGDAATQPAAPPAAAQSVPASAAEQISPPPTLDTAASGPAADGETVEAQPAAGSAAASSPIAVAVAANTPAPAPLPPAPSKWKAGVHYTLLPVAQPVSTPPGEIEVTVIFWYGCGHCYTLETPFESWEAKLAPGSARVVRLPVVWNEVTREDARLFYTIEALGKLKALHLTTFREMHVNRNPMTVIAPGNRVDTAATEQNVRSFLMSNGISAEDFGRTYRSFAVENKLRQAENLSRRYLADHTPMVVVQGKYVTDVTMAGGFDQLFSVIDDLIARERTAR